MAPADTGNAASNGWPAREDERSELVARLLNFIAERRLTTGDRLPSERELAERFDVGRNAIREAIAVLETVRLVERRPNSGIYLRAMDRDGSLDALVLRADLGVPLDEAEVAELIELRRILEVQGTELAGQRRQEDDLARIDAALEAGRRAVAAGANFAACDADFHLAVAAATRNSVLRRVVNSFYLLSRTRRWHYFADGRRAPDAQRQHEAMAAAIRAGDPAGAAALMRAHLQSTEAYWHELLQQRLPGGRIAS